MPVVAIAPASVRPCVCGLALPRCDASCNRQMLEKTFYMACLDLSGRSCLVIGAGPVGLEKVEGLLAADGRVTVIAPEAVAGVRELHDRGEIEWLERRYETADLEGRFLVVAATEDTELNVRVFRDAEQRAMLVNVVDVPPLCNFILPAIVRTGPIAIAISTSGASPALAKRMKREIAEAYGPAHARLAELLNGIRGWARDTFATYGERKVFFEELVNGDPDPIALLRSGDEDAVRALIEERQAEATRLLGR
jgi:siroheme synthase-like protein